MRNQEAGGGGRATDPSEIERRSVASSRAVSGKCRWGYWGAALLCASAWVGCENATIDGGDAGGERADGGAVAPDGGGGFELDAGSVEGTDAGAVVETDAGPPALPDAGPIDCESPDRWYRDLDGDGHGDPAVSLESCEPISGFVSSSDDCDDGCGSCFPGAAEVCDGEDNDCDGERDETQLCVPGEMVACTASCGSAGMGMCTSACQLPTGPACAAPAEMCNGMDDDCDGSLDNGFDCTAGGLTLCTTTCGSTGTGMCSGSCGLPAPTACTPPAETCNGMDDNCDGEADETFTCRVGESVSCMTSCGTTGTGSCTGSCEIPSGASCAPPAEVCNGRDDDCDGVADDTFACERSATVACTTVCGSVGTGTCSSSCGLPAPASCAVPAETCNYADDDCDGLVDEAVTGFGPPRAAGTLGLDRPRIATNLTSTRGLFRVGTQNYLYKLNRNGTAIGEGIAISGSREYDLEAANLGTVYAYIDSSGDVRVHRLEDSPTAADPFAWSRTISASATEVQLAVGNDHVFVYTREPLTSTLDSVGFTTLSMTSGSVTNSRIGVGVTTGPIAVTGNGLRLHAVAWPDTLGIKIAEYRDTTRVLLDDSTPVGAGRTVSDIALAGDYDYDARNGFLMLYAVDGPNQVHYHSYRSPTSITNALFSSVRLATRDGGFSQLDLRMRGGLAYLAMVVQSGTYLWDGAPRVYQLRPSTGATFRAQQLPTSLGVKRYEGVSLALQPVWSGGALVEDLNRMYYDGPSAGFTSMPIGCF